MISTSTLEKLAILGLTFLFLTCGEPGSGVDGSQSSEGEAQKKFECNGPVAEISRQVESFSPGEGGGLPKSPSAGVEDFLKHQPQFDHVSQARFDADETGEAANAKQGETVTMRAETAEAVKAELEVVNAGDGVWLVESGGICVDWAENLK
jgi:hypothetical protein